MTIANEQFLNSNIIMLPNKGGIISELVPMHSNYVILYSESFMDWNFNALQLNCHKLWKNKLMANVGKKEFCDLLTKCKIVFLIKKQKYHILFG